MTEAERIVRARRYIRKAERIRRKRRYDALTILFILAAVSCWAFVLWKMCGVMA